MQVGPLERRVVGRADVGGEHVEAGQQMVEVARGRGLHVPGPVEQSLETMRVFRNFLEADGVGARLQRVDRPIGGVHRLGVVVSGIKRKERLLVRGKLILRLLEKDGAVFQRINGHGRDLRFRERDG